MIRKPTPIYVRCLFQQHRSDSDIGRPSFDHLVGAADEREREGDAEGFRCLEVDKQLDFRHLLDGQISRLGALEYASGIDASLTVRLQKTACVTHQPAGSSKVARLVDRRNSVADS